MPTSVYADNYNEASGLNKLKQAQVAYIDGTGKSADRFGSAPKHLALSESAKVAAGLEMQNKLSRLQKKAPKIAAAIVKGKKTAIAGFVFSLFAQIDLTTDWLFILLFSFGLLKDILDIAFAALGAIPVLGTAGAAVGIIMSFVGDLLFLILTVTVLVLVGSSLKNRGLAKYFIGIAMEFIAEALPGINWLPWTVIYVFILYICVLYDRTYAKQADQSAQTESTSQAEKENIPSSGAADGYENQLAA